MKNCQHRSLLKKENWAAALVPLLIALAACTAEPDAHRLRITVAPVPDNLPAYDRDDWRHWVDADADCQDTRQEVLIAESKIPVTFESSESCRVASGHWTDPYTGTMVDNPSKLDIDHMVPLANAHRSGGWAWSSEQRAAYANDLEYKDHLIATIASANRSKGSDGPEDWRPPDSGYWCEYAVDWIIVKRKWDLSATEREWLALSEMLDTCSEPTQVEVTYRENPSPIPPALTPTSTPTAEPGGALVCAADGAATPAWGAPEHQSAQRGHLPLPRGDQRTSQTLCLNQDGRRSSRQPRPVLLTNFGDRTLESHWHVGTMPLY